MDPSVVGSSQFGQLFRTQLPGNYGGQPEQIFSQPLVYTPSGGDGTQYVYVATQQNNVYKLNAKTGAIVASRNLHIPFLTADLDGCVDINPHVGITATGVIDPSTDTLYLTSKTYADQSKPNVAQGRTAGRYYIHALDVNTLLERPNFPVNLEGTVARNNPIRSFNGGIHHQRPALLNVGQFVYLGFASHCVQYNFTGWIIGFDKTSGNLVERWATQGDGVPNTTPGAGVWMSGGGLASDDAGSMFFATGNGYASQLSTIPVNGRQPPTAMEEAAVHMSIGGDGSLTVTDFFMPWEKQALDGADKDLGTSPLQILPSAFSCGDVRRIGVVTGKSGKTYWINLDNMGGYRNGANRLDAVIQVYQNDNSVYAGAGVYPLEGGYIFINVINYPTNVFKFSCTAGVPSFTKVATSPAANAAILGVSHGTVTSLNNQPGTGLIWTLDVQGSQLRIYDAIPKNGAMNLIKSFSVPGSTKFGRAVFGDGIMYQGTTLGYLYAFGSPVNVPVNCTSSNDFGTVNVGNQSVARSISCTALIGVTVTDIGLDEADDFVITNAGTLPLTLTAGQTFSVSVAFKPTTVGLVSSDLLVNTTNAVAGYSQNTHVRLTGTGESSSPLLAVTPPTITFQGIIAGSNGTLSETVIISNQGNAPLSITNVQFSTTSAQGPFTTWNHETDTLTVGKFTLSNIPATIDPNSAVTVDIAFDSSVAGSFGAYLTVNSNGGSKSFTIAGSAGPAPVALIEFQTPDATGWVQYDASKNFTFGNVTENTSRSLKFRVTNNAAAGGVNLILTVSKPPFGIPGIVGAANTVDLAEGTQLAPGESATATMVCSVPKSQWNVDTYVGSAPWTMNTNDPNFEKHFFTFVCNAVSEQAPPLLPSGQGKYRYIGCYKENNPGRQLPNQLAGGTTNTNPSCIANCAAKNYVFCGTQYHTECWGGPTIPNLKVDDKNCNFDCGGELNQVCGGNGVGTLQGGAFISVFADSTQWDGNTTTPTPNPTNPTNPTNPSGPVVNPGVGQYVSAGCYTEGTNGRALPNLVNVQTQTVGNCITACAAKAYTWIGVEYGGECWCGNTLATGAIPALAADCSMTCNGNSSEYCGGPNRLNMYTLNASLPVPSSSSSTAASGTGTATSAGTGTGTSTSTSAAATTTAANSRIGDWLFQGCWTEGTGVRALPVRTYANDSMTLQSCSGFCQGLKYFGTEYGRECWCGNVLDATSKQAPLTDCSFPCPGDSTQKCGAGNRLQLYMYSPLCRLGDYPGQGRVYLNLVDSFGFQLELDCVLYVQQHHFSLVEHKLHSWTYPWGVHIDYVVVLIFDPDPTPTGPVIVPGDQNFTYYGCFSEPQVGRLLPTQVVNDGVNMTINKCLSACSDKLYAGVEYGRECWCGNSLNYGGSGGTTMAANVSSSDCSFKCPGNSTQFCGAGVRLNLYILRTEYARLQNLAGTSS
ncbi:WSC domain-containing protein [Colletotrichum sp. SAR 10_76]|nr:WSC domain-containing protein [Colletotrichum sp. SAR 10_76]